MISLQCEKEMLIIEWEKHFQKNSPQKNNDNNKKTPKHLNTHRSLII